MTDHYYISDDRRTIVRAVGEPFSENGTEYVLCDSISYRVPYPYRPYSNRESPRFDVRFSEGISTYHIGKRFGECSWEDWERALTFVWDYMFRNLSEPFVSGWEEYFGCRT